MLPIQHKLVVWFARGSATLVLARTMSSSRSFPLSACIGINEVQNSNKLYLFITLGRIVQLLSKLLDVCCMVPRSPAVRGLALPPWRGRFSHFWRLKAVLGGYFAVYIYISAVGVSADHNTCFGLVATLHSATMVAAVDIMFPV